MSINIFKIGNKWVFKHFLSDDVFKQLSDFYNNEKYRFEFYTKTNLNEAKDILKENNYDFKIIEDIKPYCVIKDKYSKRKEILRRCVYTETKNEKIIFVMKNKSAVEEATAVGAKLLEDTNLNYF